MSHPHSDRVSLCTCLTLTLTVAHSVRLYLSADAEDRRAAGRVPASLHAGWRRRGQTLLRAARRLPGGYAGWVLDWDTTETTTEHYWTLRLGTIPDTMTEQWVLFPTL